MLLRNLGISEALIAILGISGHDGISREGCGDAQKYNNYCLL